MEFLKEGLFCGTVCRIKKIYPITTTVAEAVIAFKTKNATESKVRFTDTIYEKAKTLENGDAVAILLKYHPAEHLIYVYDFCKEGQYFIGPNEETIIFAKPMKADNSIRFITKGMPHLFHEIYTNKNVDSEKTSLCVLDKGKPQMTPKGKTLMHYDTCKAFGEFVIKQAPTFNKDLIINVGVYENNPTKLSELLNVPEEKRAQVLEWMAFAADSWNPPAISSLQEQKQAIAMFLETLR